MQGGLKFEELCIWRIMESVKASDGIKADVSAASVQSVLRHVQDELVQLFQQRNAIMRKICIAKKTIVGLAGLYGDGALDDSLRELVGKGTCRRQPGLTNMCRRILMEADQLMSAQDVLGEIAAEDHTALAGHKNPVGSVTTILNRLVDYGEARRVFSENNRRVWQWVAEKEAPGSHERSEG